MAVAVSVCDVADRLVDPSCSWEGTGGAGGLGVREYSLLEGLCRY